MTAVFCVIVSDVMKNVECVAQILKNRTTASLGVFNRDWFHSLFSQFTIYTACARVRAFALFFRSRIWQTLLRVTNTSNYNNLLVTSHDRQMLWWAIVQPCGTAMPPPPPWQLPMWRRLSRPSTRQTWCNKNEGQMFWRWTILLRANCGADKALTKTEQLKRTSWIRSWIVVSRLFRRLQLRRMCYSETWNNPIQSCFSQYWLCLFLPTDNFHQKVDQT